MAGQLVGLGRGSVEHLRAVELGAAEGVLMNADERCVLHPLHSVHPIVKVGDLLFS
ncbi:hypothetical protein SDC9_156310 [bioreactor metagenome]|uniref:Uncharacterized protein n=1 Tax=bioreactor metagenome TaxID=1076179 RepID=A0A645F661_9ZZZZ